MTSKKTEKTTRNKSSKTLNDLLIDFIFSQYFTSGSHYELFPHQQKIKEISPNINFSFKNGQLTIKKIDLFSDIPYVDDCNPLLTHFFPQFSSNLTQNLIGIAQENNPLTDTNNLITMLLKSNHKSLQSLALHFLQNDLNFIEYFKTSNEQETIFRLVLDEQPFSDVETNSPKRLTSSLNFLFQHANKFLDPIPTEKLLDISKDVNNITFLTKVFHYASLQHTIHIHNKQDTQAALISEKIVEILLSDQFKYPKDILNITRGILPEKDTIDILNKLNIPLDKFIKPITKDSLSFTYNPVLKTNKNDLILTYEINPSFYLNNPDYAIATKQKKFKNDFHKSQVIFPNINNRSCMIQLHNSETNPKFILTIHDKGDFPFIEALNAYNHPENLDITMIESEFKNISSELYELLINIKYSLSHCINNTIKKYLSYDPKSSESVEDLNKTRAFLISISNSDMIEGLSHAREQRILETLVDHSKTAPKKMKI